MVFKIVQKESLCDLVDLKKLFQNMKKVKKQISFDDVEQYYNSDKYCLNDNRVKILNQDKTPINVLFQNDQVALVEKSFINKYESGTYLISLPELEQYGFKRDMIYDYSFDTVMKDYQTLKILMNDKLILENLDSYITSKISARKSYVSKIKNKVKCLETKKKISKKIALEMISEYDKNLSLLTKFRNQMVKKDSQKEL